MESPRATTANRPLQQRKAAQKQAQLPVTDAIKRRNREVWLEENREAIENYNELVAKHGVFIDGVRGF